MLQFSLEACHVRRSVSLRTIFTIAAVITFVVFPATVLAEALAPVGDVNCDGVVDGADVQASLAAVFGGVSTCSDPDVTSDGLLDASDLSMLMEVVDDPLAFNRRPHGMITLPSGDVSIAQGEAVDFAGAVSDPDGHDVTVTWDFGDGGSSFDLDPPPYTYEDSGVFTVTLLATDELGLDDDQPATLTVTVTGGSSPTGLAIDGPLIVPENGNASYTAWATMADGSRDDVTASVSWSLSTSSAQIDAGALTTFEVAADETATLGATLASAGLTSEQSVVILDQSGSVTGSHVGRFSTYEGTATCLTCHTNEAVDAHASVHYQWLGDASETVGLTTTWAGKLGGINDFCVYPDINWTGKLTNLDGQVVDGGCATCHAGLGLKPTADATTEQLENVDCLVCHSDSYERTLVRVNGQLRFVPDTAAMGVSVMQAAVDITPPSTDSCLDCHTGAGGGNNFKRGDIDEAQRSPSASLDVHLASAASGGAGLTCISCHTTVDHRMAGRGTDLRPRDLPDPMGCDDCHAARPHSNRRLDDHAARVSCTVCHIPEFARDAPTDMHRDYSAPPEVHPTKRLYEPHMMMQAHVTPDYRFFNGQSAFYEFGAPTVSDSDGLVVMSEPLGSIDDAGAKIHAFKRHRATQPMEPGAGGRLLPLKIGLLFQNGDTDGAIEQGAIAVGWGYTGHEYAETVRWMGLYHQVAPSSEALGCSDCHGGGRLDFEALGYTPMTTVGGEPLCASCHEPETGSFSFIHSKHVDDEGYDCSACHTFGSAN